MFGFLRRWMATTSYITLFVVAELFVGQLAGW